ncbi:hypothetical protein HNV12_24875 [Methanococcoides sp. SA1]|nr:hypothetical protein [Methanococcoides sp. SA1]
MNVSYSNTSKDEAKTLFSGHAELNDEKLTDMQHMLIGYKSGLRRQLLKKIGICN